MSKSERPRPFYGNLTQNPDIVQIADSEAAFEVIHDAILNLWDTVNKLSSIQPPRRERYRVTLFGSARVQSDTPLYNGVRHLASELTKMGCDIVTGGGPGLMQAANEGSVSADPQDITKSIGIRIDLGFEQETNPFVEQIYLHRTFFSRPPRRDWNRFRSFNDLATVASPQTAKYTIDHDWHNVE